MISPAAAELIRRCREQVQSGIQCVLRGELALAEVWFRAGVATMGTLEALLDEPDHRPLRKLAIVGPRDEHEDEDPEWFTRKAGDPDGAA